MVSKAKGLVKMLVIAYGMTAIMLLICSFVMYQARPGAAFIGGAVVFIYLASTFVGGLLLGKRVKEKRFLWGIGFGVAYFLVLFCVSFILNRGQISEIHNAALAFFLCVIGGMSGGMLG